MPHNTSRLPSYQCAIEFVESPNIENSIRVIGSWIGRSLIIATGMGLAGKSFEDSIKDGMVAATSIEVFVLGHAIYEVKFAQKDHSNDRLQQEKK